MALLILVSGLARLRIDRRGVRKELIWPAVKLLVACAAAVAALSLLARPFVNAVVAVDFGALYASYRLPVTDVLAWFWTAVGPLVWVVAALGLIAAFAGPGAARSRVAFVVTFGVLALLTWAVWGGQVNGHYAYGFLPVVAAGLALGAHRLLLATTRAIGRTRGSLMVTTVPGVPAVVALGLALLPAPPPALAGLMPVLSASAPPLVRNDLSELDRLVAHLQSTAAGEPIYVAASSFLLNWEVLPQAERQRARSRPASLRVLPGPDVDSRDAWPVSNLALADVVVFAEPFQHHLDPDQQRVVRAGFDAFAEGWEISADFQREAERYRLDEGIEVSVYRRIRPTSLPRIHRTLAAVEAANPTRPSGPGDWILASGRPETTALYSDPSGIQTLLAPVGRPPDPPTVLLSDRSAAQRVRGQLTVRSAACPAVELIVRERAADGSVLSEHRASGGPTTPTGIEIRLSGGAYDFVTLDVAPAAGVAVPAAGCDIELDALSLSGA
jgi:hypothetical protein